jgi:hypothetical protein
MDEVLLTLIYIFFFAEWQIVLYSMDTTWASLRSFGILWHLHGAADTDLMTDKTLVSCPLNILYFILLLLLSTDVLLLGSHVWCASLQNIQHEQRWSCHIGVTALFPSINRIERASNRLPEIDRSHESSNNIANP